MIVATVAAILLIFGGGTWWSGQIDEISKMVKQEVADGDTKDQALETLKTMQAAAKAKQKEEKEISAELQDLLQDPVSDADVLKSVLARYRRNTSKFYRKMGDGRFALKSRLTREEWERVFPDSTPSP